MPPLQHASIDYDAICRIHGGTSIGPKTTVGIKNIRKTNWKHGQRSAEAIRQRKEGAALRREIRRLADIASGLHR